MRTYPPVVQESLFDRNAFQSRFTLRYAEAKRDYEKDLETRREKLRQLIEKEAGLREEVIRKIRKEQERQEAEQKAERERVQKMKELEEQKFIEDAHRKQAISASRDLFKPQLDKLYYEDLSAQIELNRRIKDFQEMADNTPSLVSLPLEEKSSSAQQKRNLNEELETIRSIRGLKCLEEVLEKRREANELEELNKQLRSEEERKLKSIYENKISLRRQFEEQIKEKQDELIRRREEMDSVTNACLIPDRDYDEKTRLKNKALTKQREEEFLDYVRDMERKKCAEASRREQLLERMCAEIDQAKRQEEIRQETARQSLEAEARRSQIQQIQERANRKASVQSTDASNCKSFLDTMFAADEKSVELAKLRRQQNSRELREQIERKLATAEPFSYGDWGSAGGEFTRPFQHTLEKGSLQTFDHLNPLRRQQLKLI